MTNKKPGYKPDATDADGDGVVQEGTEFERPAGTDLPCADCACEDECVLEAPAAAVEEPVAAPAAPAPAKDTFTVREGDTYASIAAALAPAGTSKHAVATSLFALNRGKTLTPGIEIKVA